jgi:hypothetical protein
MEEIQEVNTTTVEASAPAMRVCKACGRELPLEEFVNKKGGGKGHVCRDCWRERCTHTQKGEDNNKRTGEKAIEEGAVGLALNGILPDAAKMEEMMAATWQSSVLRDAFCRACAMKEKDGKVYPETIIKSFSSSSAARLRKLQREHAEDGKAAPKVTKDKSASTMAPSCWEVKQQEQKHNYCLYGGYPNVGRCRWCSAVCSARLTDVHTDEEKEYVRTIKSIISDFIRDKKPKNLAYYQRIYDWLDGRHVPFSCSHENGEPADPVFSKQEYESYPIISEDTTSAKPAELDGKALLHTADKSYQIGFRDGVASVKPENI